MSKGLEPIEYVYICIILLSCLFFLWVVPPFFECDKQLEKIDKHYKRQVTSLEAQYALNVVKRDEFMKSCIEELRFYQCEAMWRD